MVTDADRGAFVRRFAAVWRSPEPETFAELWADTGTLFHPTMAAPIPHSAIPAYVERIKALVPDISLRVLNWAAIDSGVLIEWEITGSFAGEQLAWRGADRFALRGDRAVEGVAYFDTHALWARIDPSMDRGPLEHAVSMAAAHEDGGR
jgi:hypothetical protein